MSNLTDLVPPLELCKLIPAGEFQDSALVRRVPNSSFPLEDEFYEIHRRDKCESWMKDKQIPAPTLKEIVAELGQDYIKVGVDFRCYWICYVTDHYGDEIAETDNGNPATAALKLWLKMKGIEK